MASIKNVARQIVFPVTVALHLEKLFSFLSNHNKLILCYHGVVESPRHEISVGPITDSQFEKHLTYFKNNFDVVSQEAIFEMYRSDFRPKRKTIALTFDDGYENNYTRAYPLLKKFGFPATMYVISQCLDNDNSITWYDYIDLMRRDINISDIDFSALGKPRPGDINGLRKLIKSLNIAQRKVLFDEIRKQLKIEDYATGRNREHWKLMNAEQIRELSDSGLIEIGSHTHNHPNLGELAINDVVDEVSSCKHQLENVIQREVRSIAFPDGSYNEDVKQVCKDVGYKNLMAVEYRCKGDEEDKTILPRAGVSSTTTYEANMVHINMAFRASGF